MLPNPGWNVVAFEVPTAAKWNQLGENDDALAAGTGLDDGAITAPKLDLTANMLATSLAVTGSGSGSLGTSVADVGTPLNVTIPTGCVFALVLASVRLSNGTNTLGDIAAYLQYNNSVLYPENSITNSGAFHGSTVPVIQLVPVTAGVREFAIQGLRVGTASASASWNMTVIPLMIA